MKRARKWMNKAVNLWFGRAVGAVCFGANIIVRYIQNSQ